LFALRRQSRHQTLLTLSQFRQELLKIAGDIERRSLERDIDGAQPAVGAIDLEADRPALEKRAGIGRQIGAVHEHVARAVVAGEKAVAFAVVKKLDLAGDAHDSSSDALMKNARMGARPPGVNASRAGAASRVVREFAGD
jgi:hypothetical protein